MLVLAGTDRLDRELMIGQMQGKFQMIVVPGVGHMIQEVRDIVSVLLAIAQSILRTTQLNLRRSS